MKHELTVLTDINIELICGAIRSILQERAREIEGDMTRYQRESMQIDMGFTINKKPKGLPAEISVRADWIPVHRRANRYITTEDHRQMPLIACPTESQPTTTSAS